MLAAAVRGEGGGAGGVLAERGVGRARAPGGAAAEPVLGGAEGNVSAGMGGNVSASMGGNMSAMANASGAGAGGRTGGSKMETGAIVGVIVAGVAILAVFVGAIVYVYV